MRIHRIFVAAPLAGGRQVTLDPRAANHVTRVLRLRKGAPLMVFDGSGGEYAATLENHQRGKVIIRVGASGHAGVESHLPITLSQGISRGERMDYTLQKAVELGVSRIIPLWTERTQVRLDDDRLTRRIDHWRGIIISACEQCGRTIIPRLEPPIDIKQWISETGTDALRLLLDPAAAATLSGLEVPDAGVVLLAGPEGGLSAAEREFAQRHGFISVRLGPRVLRTETAALAAISSLQTLWGDFR